MENLHEFFKPNPDLNGAFTVQVDLMNSFEEAGLASEAKKRKAKRFSIARALEHEGFKMTAPGKGTGRGNSFFAPGATWMLPPADVHAASSASAAVVKGQRMKRKAALMEMSEAELHNEVST